MVATNDITGDSLISPPSNEQYREGYDRIFKPKESIQEETSEESPKVSGGIIDEEHRGSGS